MTVLVSIDTESGVMRRYDSRLKHAHGGWCRYECKDIDWQAVYAAGWEHGIVREFYQAPSWQDRRVPQ